MATKISVSFIYYLVLTLFLILSLNAPCSTAVLRGDEAAKEDERGVSGSGALFVKKGERETAVSTEEGEISTVRISDWIDNGRFHIEFITLEPNALFLPVLLQSEMVFYVHTGSGQINWTDGDETKQLELKKGDIYRLRPGSVFYIQSSLEMERQKLRIYAFFANAENDLHEPAIAPYSSIRRLILGFDKATLAAAFGVPLEAIEEITGAADPGAIVHGLTKAKKTVEMEFDFIKALLSGSGYISLYHAQNKKKTQQFNVFSNDPDFENCNGWSTVVSKKQLSALKGIDISLFMVNLTKGSMMGPHWNPRATEIGIGLQGQGMVTVVCPGPTNRTGCKTMRFHIEEGDVFAVPRFHPMAQVSFNNDSFVFMGFSTAAKNNHPQYLAGKASVFQTLDRDIISISLNTNNKTVDKILNQQEQAIILDCTSCAEEEFKIMNDEIEKSKEKARKKREEEEKKKREEEEKKKEEEERKKQEEARKREEKKRQEEEEARREEEEAMKKEEERRQEEAAREAARKEEEEARREEEEQIEKQEEMERQKEKEKEKEQKREEREKEKERQQKEEQKHQEEEAAREASRKEEEEARREEEEQREKQEEMERQKEKEKEEEQKREKEKERQQKEEQKCQEEEAAREAARREEEAKRQQEEAKKREEQRQKEEEAAQEETEKEEEARREKEEAKKREEQQRREEEAAEEAARREEEAARQQEEERRKEAAQKEEEARQHEEEQEKHEGGGWEWGEGGPSIEWGRRILKKARGEAFILP
ncbi:unnamed protein product [Cuscuta europaea]|uniref:Cupin type-1 domain-containing protein n=2 Tax=Cuscuta subgen. Cuscuta TaxID=1824621 RepID=A0A9P0YLG8_CUSEU|nr:unnamed protein product [Cuscuta europaea]